MPRLIVGLALLVALVSVSDVLAQAGYPNRPIEIIVAYNPGGAADVAARLVGGYASKKWNQPVNIVNMPGASGFTGTLRALQAKPDGYTLLLDPHAGNAMIFAVESDVPFKMDDKTQIAMVTFDPVIYTVKADSPWKTLKDVAAAAKANPKAFRYGIAGQAGVASFSVSQFLFSACVPINELSKVVFTGGAPTLTALAGGHIDFAGQKWSESSALILGGKIRGLGAVNPTRLPGMPDVPTVKEAGFPELDVVGWQGLAGPKGLPPGVVTKWNALLQEASKDPAFLEQAAKLNKVVMYMPPEPYWRFQQDALARYLPLAQKMGIRK